MKNNYSKPNMDIIFVSSLDCIANSGEGAEMGERTIGYDELWGEEPN